MSGTAAAVTGYPDRLVFLLLRQAILLYYLSLICVEEAMHEKSDIETMTAGLDVGITRSAQDSGMAKLTALHRERVTSLPQGAEQEIRVLVATLLPGDVTPRHWHRFPVTVYMIEGVFTLELDDREPVNIEAGQVFVEPAHIGMTGCNKGEVPARMALFYACEPDAPFAESLKPGETAG